MKAVRLLPFLAACSLLIVFACSRYGNDLQYVEVSRVNVLVTDAPFPMEMIEEASVTITRIDARMEGEAEEADFETLFEGNETLNLVELNNGVTTSLGQAEIPVGTYDQLRVYVTDARIKVLDGETYDLKVPSGSQSGVKVNIKPGLMVVTTLTADLLLDFDISKSFVLQGNLDSPAGIKGFSFKPVIKASNMTETGSIGGFVSEMLADSSAPVEGAEIQVIAADTVYASGFTNELGLYTILGVEEGIFEVRAAKMGYLEASATDVQVVKGNLSTQDFVLEVEE